MGGQSGERPTVGLAARAVQVVMQLDDGWRYLQERTGGDPSGGPARVFRHGFDPSITFQDARLDLTEEVIAALEQMRHDLAEDGFFGFCRDRSLEEDSQLLLDKLRARLETAGQTASG